MTDQEKLELKESIQKRILDLEKSIAGLKELTKPISPDRALGRVTRAEAQATQGLHVENLAKAEHNYAKLKETLQSIDEDYFGLCSWCNKPIELTRLMAIPETTRCIRCA